MSEKISVDTETRKQGKGDHMSDVATANFLVEKIGGKRHVGDMLHTAWKELNRIFPHKMDPENKWTERRLKSWWYGESRTVQHFQMMELYETAEAIRAARNEHAEYKAKTARLVQMAALRMASKAGVGNTDTGG